MPSYIQTVCGNEISLKYLLIVFITLIIQNYPGCNIFQVLRRATVVVVNVNERNNNS